MGDINHIIADFNLPDNYQMRRVDIIPDNYYDGNDLQEANDVDDRIYRFRANNVDNEKCKTFYCGDKPVNLTKYLGYARRHTCLKKGYGVCQGERAEDELQLKNIPGWSEAGRIYLVNRGLPANPQYQETIEFLQRLLTHPHLLLQFVKEKELVTSETVEKFNMLVNFLSNNNRPRYCIELE